MKGYLIRKRIFTVLFLLFIFIFGFVNVFQSGHLWLETVKQAEDPFSKETINKVEKRVMTHITGRIAWIEGYSWMQVLQNKKSFDNFTYVKSNDGSLHYASFFTEDDNNIEEYAKRIKRLQDYVSKKGTKVIFVMTPSKYEYGEVDVDETLPINDPNYVVDEMLFYLNRYGVETLDLRNYFPYDDLKLKDSFFKTDHHWTVPAAFRSTKILTTEMEKRFNVSLDPDGKILDEKNYKRVTYKDVLLGSMGRKTGIPYGGLDDYEAIYAPDTGNYTWNRLDLTKEKEVYKGSWKNVFINEDVFDEKDIYNESFNSLYMDSMSYHDVVVNHDKKDGYKMLAIRDSYFTPVISFMAPMFNEIEAIWSVEPIKGLEVETLVEKNDYDFIVFEIYPYNICEEAFDFFKGDK